MDKKTEQLKAEIAQTKAELKEKAAAFENRIREDVSNAGKVVEGAVHNVQSVAEGLSLKKLVEKRPLLMLGGSIASGVVIGSMLAPRSHPIAVHSGSPDRGDSWSGRIQDRFPEEVRILKTIAFTYFVNFVADKAKGQFPDFVQKITEFEERITATFSNPSEPAPDKPKQS